MLDKEVKTTDISNDQTNLEEEIDLVEVWKSILRRKKLISAFALISLSISSINASLQKNIWGGQFQIVISSKQSITPQSELANTGLGGILGLSMMTGGKQSINTEIEILKSPSVLSPVFEFVKNKKREKSKSIDSWRYSSWLKSNLIIKNVKGTNVLDLSYKDTDKEIILPVLSKISEQYQKYSNRDRYRDIDNGINYLNSQIELFKERSNQSSRQAMEFIYKNNLSFVEKKNGSFLLESEVRRNKAEDSIVVLNKRISNLNKLKDEDINTVLIAANAANAESNSLLSRTLLEQLNNLNQRIEILKLDFKEDSEPVKILKDRKKVLLQNLKKQTYNSLVAMRSNALVQLEASKRPKEIILKFKDLTSKALRDENTLIQLENEKRYLTLESSRITDPWELITKPTILLDPLEPDRPLMIAIGTLFGLFIGILVSLALEKKENLVYKKDDIKLILKYPLLGNLYKENNNEWKETFEIISNSPVFNVGTSNIALLHVGDIQKDIKDYLSHALDSSSNSNKVYLTENLIMAKKADFVLLIIKIGSIRYNDLIKLRSNMELLNLSVLGFLTLE